MRVLTIKEATGAEELSARVLASRLSAARSEAALAQLQELNPHVDFNNIQPGTVLFVPDAPGFKTSETDSPLAAVLQDFEKLVKSGLNELAARSKAAADARQAQANEVAKTLKSAAFRRAAEQDPEVQSQAAAAAAALKKQQQEDDHAQEVLGTVTRNALGSIRSIMGR